MPLYTFQCVDCGAQSDLFLRLDRRNDTYTCGACCAGWFRRIFTPPSLRGETVSKS